MCRRDTSRCYIWSALSASWFNLGAFLQSIPPRSAAISSRQLDVRLRIGSEVAILGSENRLRTSAFVLAAGLLLFALNKQTKISALFLIMSVSGHCTE